MSPWNDKNEMPQIVCAHTANLPTDAGYVLLFILIISEVSLQHCEALMHEVKYHIATLTH